MLSPDPFIQDPANSQNFNRYSYALNNPMVYTDPSGYGYNGGGSTYYIDGLQVSSTAFSAFMHGVSFEYMLTMQVDGYGLDYQNFELNRWDAKRKSEEHKHLEQYLHNTDKDYYWVDYNYKSKINNEVYATSTKVYINETFNVNTYMHEEASSGEKESHEVNAFRNWVNSPTWGNTGSLNNAVGTACLNLIHYGGPVISLVWGAVDVSGGFNDAYDYLDKQQKFYNKR